MKIGTLLALLLVGAANCQAQCGRGDTYVEPKSATEWESYLRGLARLMEGAGKGHRDMAQGVKTLQEARRIQIHNRSDALRARFESQALNRAARDAARDKPFTFEQYQELAKRLAPARLNPWTLTAEGSIHWPPALLDDRYAGHRGALEWLMKVRTTATAEQQLEVRLAVEDVCRWLRRDLQRRTKQLPTDAWITAKQFVDSLAYEVRFAPDALWQAP
jgi:hypothetical protein